jgi:hypothetical protein
MHRWILMQDAVRSTFNNRVNSNLQKQRGGKHATNWNGVFGVFDGLY